MNNPRRKKNKKCKLCKKFIDDRATYCVSCAGIIYNKVRVKTRRSYKGINNPVYIDGKTLKLYYCSICGKKLGISAYSGSKYCRKCFGKGIDKHHLDLNKNNNRFYNLWFMPHRFHHIFHFTAYRYLLERFGIKEILRYKQWFFKKYMKK